MRYQGKIDKWIDDKGFGFITQNGSNKQAFVHISAFEKGHQRPYVGEIVSYEITSDAKKGLKAHKVKYVNRPATQSISSDKKYIPINGVNIFKWICIVALLLISPYLYKKITFPKGQEAYVHQELVESKAFQGSNVTPLTANTNFQCAGKTKCSEMTSCEEATFYLNQCPGTIADGDGDGIPCEDQWCGH